MLIVASVLCEVWHLLKCGLCGEWLGFVQEANSISYCRFRYRFDEVLECLFSVHNKFLRVLSSFQKKYRD